MNTGQSEFAEQIENQKKADKIIVKDVKFMKSIADLNSEYRHRAICSYRHNVLCRIYKGAKK